MRGASKPTLWMATMLGWLIFAAVWASRLNFETYSALLARVVSSYIQEVSLPDTLPIVVSALVLVAAAMLASLMPAARASRVDVIQGDVTGPVSDKDTFTAPTAKVVRTYEVNKSSGTGRLTYDLGRVDRPVYVRLRGSDGNGITVYRAR